MSIINSYIQARNYTRGRSVPIDVLVTHDMEYPERQTAAEWVARWFGGLEGDPPIASAHYCIDEDSIVQCVRDEDVAWHAPGANHNGLGFEHAGYKSQQRRDWLDDYSTKMLRLSAALYAIKCKQYHIPLVWLTPTDLLNRKRGITDHKAVSNAFHRTDHTDVGDNFPIQQFLKWIAEEGGGSTGATQGEPLPVLIRGSKGWAVKKLQKLLNDLPYIKIHVSEHFDRWTTTAVLQFQKHAGLEQDGVVGPKTWRSLLATAVHKP
jgi:murein L,D-transpeptidase YcbB/YkuD